MNFRTYAIFLLDNTVDVAYISIMIANEKTNRMMRAFRVRVMIVPTMLEVKAFGAKIRTEWRTIYGYNRRDAMARAGIQ